MGMRYLITAVMADGPVRFEMDGRDLAELALWLQHRDLRAFEVVTEGRTIWLNHRAVLRVMVEPK